MRYLIDKALSPQTVTFLKEMGFNAVRVNEVFSKRIVEDEEIYNYALTNNYIIITMDLDFGHILALTKTNKPSTIILRLDDPRVLNVNTKLIEILPKIEKNLLDGSIIIIEENRVRSRLLPIQ